MPSETCLLLQDIEKGDREAVSRLLPLVYAELRRLAGHYMRSESPGHTLQPTALVHEAYMRLVGNEAISINGRTHFVALAATSMRRILVESERRRLAVKRGGGKVGVLDDSTAVLPAKSTDLLALDEALDRLALFSPRQARVVELRFFAGLAIDEIAGMEGLSERTIKADWSIARAWLHREIGRGG